MKQESSPHFAVVAVSSYTITKAAVGWGLTSQAEPLALTGPLTIAE